MSKVGVRPAYARYLRSSFLGLYNPLSIAFGIAGRINIVPIDVAWAVVIDKIIYVVGSVAAGNVRLGIYRQGAEDTPRAGALVVESASVPQAAVHTIQMVSVADTLLTPGQYYLAIQGDNATGTLWRYYDTGCSFAWRYDRGGGYGAFTTPCPEVNAIIHLVGMMLRVKTNLGL